MNNIQLLDHTEINSIKSLLNLNGLPDSDLEMVPIHFFGIKKKNQLITIGALEIYGINAIIRSIAVHQKFQNLGYGKLITQFLEQKAVEMKIQKLFLLTTTAESFFRKLNYLPILREQCPHEIQASTQFREICPTTASCLFKIIPT